ncbi:hypothetical protein AMK59_4969, partial [Oryctes borbonicus]
MLDPIVNITSTHFQRSDIYQLIEKLDVSNRTCATPMFRTEKLRKGSLEMAAVSSGRSVMDPQRETGKRMTIDERFKILYPNVDEEKTPLSRCWSTKDRYHYIGLSQNNLRVHYKARV